MTPVPPAHGAFLHGLSALALAYGVVYGTAVAGCIVGKAPYYRYVQGLFTSLVQMLIGAAVGGLVGFVLPQWLAAGIGIAVCLLAAFGFGRKGFDIPVDPKHERGAIVELAKGASFWSIFRAPKASLPGQLTLAGLRMPPLDETKHVKMIGTTGTGKTTAIREILDGALYRGDRAVFADPDGGYLDLFYNPDLGDVILNPFDARSLKWDIWSELREPYDFPELARSLIPDGVGEARIWHHYGQTFLTAVLRQAHAHGVRETSELFRLLTSAPLEELQLLLEGTPAQPFVTTGNQRMFLSVRSVTTSAISALEYIQRQRAELLSIRDWIRKGRGVLFLPYTAGQIAALRSMISTWMRMAIFETLNLPEGDARIWFVIDELDALGAIDGLKDALPRLRKHGGRCVLGFQSIAQVSATYGQGEADTLVENCGNTLILRCSASEGGGTARFASRLIGERDIVRQTISRSRHPDDWISSTTTSEQHTTESAVLASEIEQLPDLQGYLKFASDPNWKRVALSYQGSDTPKAPTTPTGVTLSR
jgi:type IV secretory pathway TraG/TraD family ATPase VirD4